MEALVLTTALRVIRPTVQDRDAELEQPYAQPGPTMSARIAPWAAVVDEERLRQPIALEGQL